MIFENKPLVTGDVIRNLITGKTYTVDKEVEIKAHGYEGPGVILVYFIDKQVYRLVVAEPDLNGVFTRTSL